MWKYYCYMFRPYRVIIRQSLHEYVNRYWVVHRFVSRSVIYKLSFDLRYNFNS
jgi:hypothetical protein